MSIRHADIELAFINETLIGLLPDGGASQRKDLCGKRNYPVWGGGTTWVAPELRWAAGVPPRDLDSGPYTVLNTWCDSGSMGVELRSGVCSQSGLQVARRIELCKLGTWTTNHRLINRSNETIECGVWDVLMLSRAGVVSVRLDADDNENPQWHERLVSCPGKGSVGDLRRSRFVRIDGGVLSSVCDEAVEFKVGIVAPRGVLSVCVSLPEGERHLTRRFEVFDGARYLHGAAIEVFNASDLPYFSIELHSPACSLVPGAACEFHVEDCVSQKQ